jgi:subtilase family serine protease
MKTQRVAVFRFEALELRELLSSVSFHPTIKINYQLSPAQLAAVPTGNITTRPTNYPQVGGGGSTPFVSAPYTPAEIRHAYGVDQLPYDGTGQTIAIIDAYDNPTIAQDLADFSTKYGLPQANFEKATPGGTPAYDSGWAGEIALDVEWAHAIAPKAKILLVEAVDAGQSLYDAVTYAVGRGASQISMSFGADEYNGDGGLDSYFNHPGVTFFASSGDTASQVSSPATSPYVVSVGGTAITLDNSSNRVTESAWDSGGGGPSAYTAIPSYQKGINGLNTRTSPDVAYDADPNTGVIIDVDGQYFDVGGTSAGSPQWAGLAALANQGRVAINKPTLGTGTTYGLNETLYKLAAPSGTYTNPNGDFFDVTTGSNGHPAGTGYDLATGLGSPIANKLIPDLVGKPTGIPPTIVGVAAATPNPVYGRLTQLSVSASDPTGEPNLTYFWTTTASPNGVTSPTFSDNSDNSAKRNTVTFYATGNYTFQVTVTNRLGAYVTSTVNVTVNPTLTSLAISPSKSQLSAGGSLQFSAFDADQFGNQISSSALPLTWTLNSGNGTLSNNGFYQAPAVGTIASVSVSAGQLRNTATVYVLSNPWQQTDVGGPPLAGNAADNGQGNFTAIGSGTGVSGTADQFAFTNLTLNGNATAQAQVVSVPYTNSTAESGVMFRNDASAGSPEVSLGITPSNTLVFSYRAAAGGTTNTLTTRGIPAGDYVRIVRVGNLFTGSYSANGTTWTTVGSISLPGIGTSALSGLIQSSGTTTLGTSTFAHVLADSTPTVLATALANPNPVSTATTTLSVLGGDDAGEPSLKYTWVATGVPAGAIPPTFATNGTNASKSDVVTFSKAGTYVFTVTLANALGYTTTSSVTVSVVATKTIVKMTPTTATVRQGQTFQFVTAVYDQFNQKLPSQPIFTYSMVAGGAGGKISSTGLYTAPSNRTGIDYVNVSGGGASAVATVTVIAATNPGLVFGPPIGTGTGSTSSTPGTPSVLVAVFPPTDPTSPDLSTPKSKAKTLPTGPRFTLSN